MDAYDQTAPRLPIDGDRAGANAASPPEIAATIREESLYSVLAERARSHSRAHLMLAMLIGIVDAAAIQWAHPAFWPVAAVFAAGGAYGAWGLADRALAELESLPATRTRWWAKGALRTTNVTLVAVGIAALLAAFGGIWHATLDGWRH